ncbi:MAG: 6-phosphogluconolactonase [Burkholderiales bacterium PBB3]|nr:MAG: 6-phosphogluconolactonase [Burkholderiales bacterium PBB3]
MALLLNMNSVESATLVYVSNADSQEISVLELIPSSGTLRAVQTLAVGGLVMPLAVSPDKRFLYAAMRSEPYRVVSYAIDASTGRLRQLGEAPLADNMANIDTDATGRWLFSASYAGSKISVNTIGADGIVGVVHQTLPSLPKAHAIHSDAANRFVVTASLGGDTLSVWQFDATQGLLAPHTPAHAGTGLHSGARHFAWDRRQKYLYVLNELDASVVVFAWSSGLGTLRELQRISTLATEWDGRPSAADIHLSPDGKFLYTSERVTSAIAAFQIEQHSGLLTKLGHVATEKTPRSFGIDAEGKFLVVAGQHSNSVSVHPIGTATGLPGSPKRFAVGKNPSWVQILNLP